jgi:hypothetical protein
MRSWLICLAPFFFCSCGDSNGPRPVADLDSIVTKSSYDSLPFLATQSLVSTISLPVLVYADSLSKFKDVSLDERTAYALLPGEFEYESYSNVSCIAASKIGVQPLLWIRLESEGDYEESPDNVDIMLVLYDCNYRPIDVYNVACSDLGHSYSFVRSDSVFTVEFDEMENINVNTSCFAVTESGFVVGETERQTFRSKESGYIDSRRHAAEFLSAHGYSSGETVQ